MQSLSRISGFSGILSYHINLKAIFTISKRTKMRGYNAAYQAVRPAKMKVMYDRLWKDLEKKNARKKKPTEVPEVKFDKYTLENKNYSYLKPRVANLNVIFMQQIAQIMNTGEIQELVMKYGLEITQVMLSPDYKNCNVYWIAVAVDLDEYNKINRELHLYAGPLKKAIFDSHLLGRPPNFRFVIDRAHLTMKEIEKRFEIADFGPEYESLDEGMNFEPLLSTEDEINLLKTNMVGVDRGKMIKKLLEYNCTSSKASYLSIFDKDDANQNIMHLNPKHLIKRKPSEAKTDYKEDHDRVDAIPQTLKSQEREDYLWKKMQPLEKLEFVPTADDYQEKPDYLLDEDSEFDPQDIMHIVEEISQEKSLLEDPLAKDKEDDVK